MSVNRTTTEIPFEEALALLENAEAPMAGSLVSLIKQAFSGPLQDGPPCLLAKYSLFDFVSLKGVPYLPGQRTFEALSPFLQENGFPFGFVVKNGLTVQMPSLTSDRGVADILTILKPGAPIGLFELFGKLSSGYKFPVQPWTIMAGTKNVYPLKPVLMKPYCVQLSAAYDELVNVNAFKQAKNLSDALTMFGTWRSAVSEWNVQVIYFSKQLVERLGLTKTLQDMTSEQYGLSLRLSRMATARLSDAQNYFLGLWHIFRGNIIGDHPIKSRRHAFEFWVRMLSSAVGERPIYQLTETDSILFPVKETAEFLSAKGGAELSHPLFLPADGNCEIGYLPLDEVIPLNAPQDIRGVSEQIYYALVESDNGNDNLPINSAEFFSALKFRISRGHKAGVEYLYLNIDNGRLSWPTVNIDELDHKSFWSNENAAHYMGQNFEKPLNGMVRIDLNRIRYSLRGQ